MNQDRGDIGASLVELIPLLRARFGVKRIGLFGSTARGTHRPTSDSDILVESREGGATFDNFMELIFFLEDKTCRPGYYQEYQSIHETGYRAGGPLV
jgi:predicted nucleotidyltransferase